MRYKDLLETTSSSISTVTTPIGSVNKRNIGIGFNSDDKWRSIYNEEQDENEVSYPSIKEIIKLKNDFVEAAQKVYDNWNQDDEYDDLNGGGICHLIADKIVDVLYDKFNNIQATTVSSSHEVHVYVVVAVEEGIYLIDIPYSIYERGGGYSWKKIPDVKFDKDDIIIKKISSDRDDFENYID